MLYLEECYHQIAHANHQLEIHSMRFFGAVAEGAAIEVLTLIDWATEFLELSCSPIPEILAFLRRPFIVGKRVQFPIPEDPGDVIDKKNLSVLRPKRHGCTSGCSCSSGLTRQRRNLVRSCMGTASACQSYDCTDKGRAQPQFWGTFPDYVGFHCRIYILDPSSSLFQTCGERALLVRTKPHTGHAEPTRGCH